MHCIITSGPTYEALDQVRRLINFSTGKLGAELANHLAGSGHRVTLLRAEHATFAGQIHCERVLPFGTGADLARELQALADGSVNAVFHAAAVSDFSFGQIFQRGPAGDLTPIQAKKIPSDCTGLFAELVPTTKIIGRLREWFPQALLVGWKYEVDGDRASAVMQGLRQIAENRTDLCVVNGPAYGDGFGLATKDRQVRHVANPAELFIRLGNLLVPGQMEANQESS